MECHAAMSVGGCWYFLEKCWKTGGKRTRCPRQPIRTMDGVCRRPRHDENRYITFRRKFTPGDATSRRDVPFAVGVRGFFTNSQVTEQLKLSISILHTSFCGENAQKQYRRFDDNIQTSEKLQEISCNWFVNVLSSNYSNGNVTGNNTDTDSETVTGTYKNYEVTRANIKER